MLKSPSSDVLPLVVPIYNFFFQMLLIYSRRYRCAKRLRNHVIILVQSSLQGILQTELCYDLLTNTCVYMLTYVVACVRACASRVIM